jgi:hypothetical protein
LIDFSALEAAGYDVIWGILGAEIKQEKVICNSPNDVISGTLRVKKSINFYYKDILHFFLKSPNYYTYQKSYLVLVAL